MSWIDWLIVIIPVAFVFAIGIYSTKYIRSVADFLSAGRICGRYIINVGDIANALSIIVIIASIEVYYKTGFALSFWQNLMLPMGMIMGLTGFCYYRFRETKAMSLGQFLEMRYSRSFRIFAAFFMAIAQSTVCFAVALCLDLPLSINIAYAILLMLPVSLFYISMGLLFGSILNVKQVGGVCGALLTNLSAWLSGVWFDLDLVGGAFKKIAEILPFSHAVELERAAIGGEFSTILPHFLIVLAYAVIITVCAILLFLRQMKKR